MANPFVNLDNFNPFLTLRVYINNLTRPDCHITAGDIVLIQTMVVNTQTFVRVLADANTIKLTVFRTNPDFKNYWLNSDTNNTDSCWTDGTPNTPATTFDMTTSLDPTIYQKIFSSTAAWKYDIRAGVRCLVAGVPVIGYRQEQITGDYFHHSEKSPESNIIFDPLHGHHHTGTDSRHTSIKNPVSLHFTLPLDNELCNDLIDSLNIVCDVLIDGNSTTVIIPKGTDVEEVLKIVNKHRI